MLLLGVTVLIALVGWLLGKDPGQLMVVFGGLSTTQAALEAGNVGKRATFKKEAVKDA